MMKSWRLSTSKVLSAILHIYSFSFLGHLLKHTKNASTGGKGCSSRSTSTEFQCLLQQRSNGQACSWQVVVLNAIDSTYMNMKTAYERTCSGQMFFHAIMINWPLEVYARLPIVCCSVVAKNLPLSDNQRKSTTSTAAILYMAIFRTLGEMHDLYESDLLQLAGQIQTRKNMRRCKRLIKYYCTWLNRQAVHLP